jgi:hypothetical protein
MPSYMCAQVATPVQAARADQLCYPHLPDVLAMCAALTGSGGGGGGGGSGNGARPAAPPAKRLKVEPGSAAPEGATSCPSCHGSAWSTRLLGMACVSAGRLLGEEASVACL